METYLTLPSPRPRSLALPAPSSMNMRQASGAEGTCVVHRSTPGGRTLNSMLLQCDTQGVEGRGIRHRGVRQGGAIAGVCVCVLGDGGGGNRRHKTQFSLPSRSQAA